MDSLRVQRINDRSPISADRLVRDLRRIGLSRGDNVTLGVSLKRLGYVTGGPDTVVEALLQAVGGEGTIMISTATETFLLEAIQRGEVTDVYDPKSTPSVTGWVPESVRAHRGAVRSRHPCNSITAIGRYASYLTAGHDANAGAYSPYTRLARIDGKFLGIGIDDRMVGVRHEAQARAGLLGIAAPVYGARYRDDQGNLQVFEWRDIGGCVRRLPELVQALRAEETVDGYVGEAKCLVVSVRQALDTMSAMLRNEPARSLCHDPDCRWCGALEEALKRGHGSL